jgi:excisionase family DNA binding protein
MEENIRINEKFLLTLKEAALYYNIGINRLRDITNQDGCDFVIWSGNKRLIKRKALEEYLTAAYSA